MLDVDTVASPRSFEPRCTRRRCRCARGRRAARRRGGDRPSAGCGRPATTPRPRARWGSASSTTSPSRRATRSTRTASSECWCSTGTSITATGRTTSSTRATGALREHPPVAAVSGHGLARRERRRRGRGLHDEPSRSARLGPRRVALLVQHVVAADRARLPAGLLLVSAGFDAHRDDPLAECRLTDESFLRARSDVRGLASELGAPLAFLLEGGYRPRLALELGGGGDGSRSRRGSGAGRAAGPDCRSGAFALLALLARAQ